MDHPPTYPHADITTNPCKYIIFYIFQQLPCAAVSIGVLSCTFQLSLQFLPSICLFVFVHTVIFLIGTGV